RPSQGDPVLPALGGGVPGGGTVVRDPGQLVDPHAPRRPGGAGTTAPGEAGVAADVRAVAEPDREGVAVAASRRAETAPASGRLGSGASAGAWVPRSVRAGVAAPV